MDSEIVKANVYQALIHPSQIVMENVSLSVNNVLVHVLLATSKLEISASWISRNCNTMNVMVVSYILKLLAMVFVMARERCVVENGALSLGIQNNVMMNVFTDLIRVMEPVKQVGRFHVESSVLTRTNPVKEDALTRSIHTCVWDIMARRHVFMLKRLEMEQKIA